MLVTIAGRRLPKSKGRQRLQVCSRCGRQEISSGKLKLCAVCFMASADLIEKTRLAHSQQIDWRKTFLAIRHKMTIRNKLANRDAKKWTQADLAYWLKISEIGLNDIKHYRRAMPEEIFAKLKEEFSELIFYKESPDKLRIHAKQHKEPVAA